MIKLNATQLASKWKRRLQGSTEDIKNGVEQVTESPTAKAAQKVDKWHQRVSAQETKDRFVKGLKKVSLEDWKSKMIDKGIGRISAGAEAAEGKMQAFAEKLIPHLEAGQKLISEMPDLTLEDSIARSTAHIKHMAKLKTK